MHTAGLDRRASQLFKTIEGHQQKSKPHRVFKIKNQQSHPASHAKKQRRKESLMNHLPI
jgi:hypothetical protein